jgi:hypothetical protein
VTALRTMLIVVGVCVFGAILARDWRAGLLCLVGTGLATTGFIAIAAQVGELPIAAALTQLVLVEIVAALTTTTILLLSARAHDRRPDVADVEAPGLGDLSQFRGPMREPSRERWVGYVGPSLAVALVLAITVVLPRLYVVETTDVAYAFMLLMAGGIATLLVADSLLKIGIGLQLLLHGLTLFYLGLSPRVSIVPFGLLKGLAVALALIVAYLCALMYRHGKTLALETLYDDMEEGRRTNTVPAMDETL